MTVYINNEPFEFSSTANVEELLRKATITDHNGMALAVNNTVIPKKEWNKYALKENDKIIIIKATQGG